MEMEKPKNKMCRGSNNVAREASFYLDISYNINIKNIHFVINI